MSENHRDESSAAEPTNPASARTLVVVRHGMTDWNAEDRLQGHLDIPLNEEGVRQARGLCATVRSYRFDHIYSSPLLRARQTVEIVAKNREISYDWRIAEINHGVWQGLTKEEIASRWPEEWRLWRESPASYTPDGGESLFELEQRIHRFLSEAKGSTILCVTHGQVIQTIFSLLCRRPPEEFRRYKPKNGDVNVFELI